MFALQQAMVQISPTMPPSGRRQAREERHLCQSCDILKESERPTFASLSSKARFSELESAAEYCELLKKKGQSVATPNEDVAPCTAKQLLSLLQPCLPSLCGVP